MKLAYPAFLLTAVFASAAEYRDIPTEPKPGDALIAEYFALETRKIANRSLVNIKTREDWEKARPTYRKQLFEMLGMQPLPKEKDAPLQAKITGRTELDDIIVENLVFQSLPGLYVTANFYRPRQQEGPLPVILYVCGHGPQKKNGISYGNKATYQHHGTWFARNGYVCLTIDSLQLGEIEAIHHGTYRYGRWWWHARGYTSAGVEAWNCIRALDYLETRAEVDKEKIGVTGRSGGGAYSWWISALDDRIKVSVPVAGIASMQNHVVDGCVEGHCDCMYQLNTYRWDFAQIAALVAPRPLLIANTDKDRIFPLDGVVDVYTKTKRIYDLLGAGDKIGLAIYEGGHKDTQPLRVDAFHWFERFLKGREISEEMENTTAPKILEIEQLRVLESIPEDERNTRIDELFTRRIGRTPKPPASKDAWTKKSGQWKKQLKSRVFRGWPTKAEDLAVIVEHIDEREGIRFSRIAFTSQKPYRMSLYLAHRAGLKPSELDLVVLNVLDDEGWGEFLVGVGAAFPKAFPDIDLPALDTEKWDAEKTMHAAQKWGTAYFAPRGIGPTSWTDDAKERVQILRRFALVGQTLDGMRVWDIRRAAQALRVAEVPLWLQASGAMAGNALYASLFESGIERLDLHGLPTSHREGPVYLNVLRFLNTPQALAIALENSQVRLYTDDREAWKYAGDVGAVMGWDLKRFSLRKPVGP